MEIYIVIEKDGKYGKDNIQLTIEEAKQLLQAVYSLTEEFEEE